jgi:hypothetical protein
MDTEDKKIILNLNEFDVLRLLALIKRTINQGDNVWQSYWEHFAQDVEQIILNSVLKDIKDRQITLKLSEHNASQLLKLIKRAISQADGVWQSYWEHVGQDVEQMIRHGNDDVFQYHAHYAENALLREFMQWHLEPGLTTGNQVINRLLAGSDNMLTESQKQDLTTLQKIVDHLGEVGKRITNA